MLFYGLYLAALLTPEPAVQKTIAPNAPAVYLITKPFKGDVIIRPFSG